MGERTITHVDRRTGEVSTRTTHVEGDQGFGERMKGLIAEGRAALASEPEETHAVVVCDGCGARVELNAEAPEMPAGWSEQPDGDFCPNCTEARR